MVLVALLSLGAIPVAAWWCVRAYAPQHTWLVMGVTIGAVITPFSRGLWGASYYIMPEGILIVMLGVASSLIHSMPGFQVAEWLGISRNVSLAHLDLLNGVIWAAVYGTAGFLVGRANHSRERRSS